MLLIRWLGAFGGRPHDLETSLRWEISQREREVSAERLDVYRHHGVPIAESRIRSWVGVGISPQAVIRGYRGDVWSFCDHAGRLRASRRAVRTHSEFFCRPGYINCIWVKVLLGRMRPEIARAIKTIAEEFSLPVRLLHSVATNQALFQELKKTAQEEMPTGMLSELTEDIKKGEALSLI